MGRLKRLFSSLRVRLTLWYVLVLGVLLVAFGVLLYNAVRLSQFREVETQLAATAEILKNRLENVGFASFLVDPSELPLGMETYVQIVRPQRGEILLRSDNLSQADLTLPLHDASWTAALRGQSFLENVSLDNGEHIRLLTQSYARTFFIEGILQVGVSYRQVEQNLAQLRYWLWAVVPVILLLTSLGGMFLADRLLRPLVQMNAGAREISDRHLNRRLPVVNPNDEMGKLAATLNQLFDRIERAFQNQQRFIADASHELRTPLAAMRAEIEVALRRPRSPEEYGHLIRSNLDEVQRLSRMAERLLFLTQSDAGQLPLRQRQVELPDLCQRVLDKLGSLARERRLLLGLRELAPAAVQGDPELLTQLLMILVENALKYTTQGGQVWLACGRDGPWAWLTVEDTGPGIPPAHLPHLFERFYRVDKARSRHFGGTGLGLSIARSIVEAHGGRIEVDSDVGRGTTFCVRLPATPPPMAAERPPQD